MGSAREMLIRWANASFRLMWLETWQSDLDAVAKDLVESEQLLTQAEWDCLSTKVSKCTHIYQWMNNVLHVLAEKGYIKGSGLLKQMHIQLDEMRGANVWGLPSLPLPYTLIITIMVKFHLLTMFLAQ